ncbi:Zn-dependent exopeptidase [Cucurbitaria berberidis CBS 394.84]|uniref:Zn-dependent exopeptidase n=1 Tax=Cucurbitaria berberidis CBS 394.84 TaxID=1168544 RepID=A0A9P4L4G9_9PLEO|nr:Zn-dependent exopeptidase [Cucurbitaria berberidis CBS 394.84]KAF1841971.1 Zn-dependent exopeptidase [Cucurbitaria berberidis CBS 394.84]
MAVIASLLGCLLLSVATAAPQAASLSSSVSSVAVSPSATDTSLTTAERAELFSLHEELVNIPSISNDEVKCADFVSKYLEELGYYVDKVPVGNTSTYNVFAYPQGLKDEGVLPEVLITSHIDTVPPFYPFERREKNGTVYHYGRGTVDAKGPVATMIIASHKFFQSRSDTPRLGMLFVVGEEIGGTGMKAFASYAKNTTFRAAIFGEPTEGKLASGHKGSLSLTLDVKGKAAHSAYPWLGVSAINYLAEAIVALNSLQPALPSSKLLGPTTLNAGLIRGGVAGNVVPEIANASVSIRISRSEDDAVTVVRDMITGMLSPIVTAAKAANATFNLIFANSSYPAPILDTDVEGLEVAPVFYGTDIPSLPQVKKRYLFGTGTIEVAHTPNEQLSQDELVQAAEAYGLILKSLFPES